MEREIKEYGLTHDPQVARIDKMKWNYDPWISKKTVSLFNLGIALELMLKLLLELHERERPTTHKLTALYDALPTKLQEELEKAYQVQLSKYADVSSIVAFRDYKLPDRDKRPPRKTPDITTLRGHFDYFDSDVLLATKRYSFERLSEDTWHYYIDDISIFEKLIDGVLISIGANKLLNTN